MRLFFDKHGKRGNSGRPPSPRLRRGKVVSGRWPVKGAERKSSLRHPVRHLVRHSFNDGGSLAAADAASRLGVEFRLPIEGTRRHGTFAGDRAREGAKLAGFESN